MVYRIYDNETGMLLTGYPSFETLDELEDYLDNMAEAWDVIDDTEKGTVYEVTFYGEELVYLMAILEA